MAKDPAFLFYSQDFYLGAATMSFEDRGKYITILCLMHQKGRLSEESICFVVGLVSVNLKSKFSIDENGLWYNSRLESETEKRNNYTESRRKNGSKGGRGKKKEDTDEKHMQNHMVSHMEDENILYSNNTLNYNTVLNYYKSDLIQILINVFEKEKAETLEEIKTFEMIVVEMNKIWMKHKPSYTFLKDADYPALLQIAYLIATVKKISKHDAVNDKFKSDEIVTSFDKITSYLVNTENKFHYKLNISGVAISKNFQSIVESMKDLTPTVKSEKLEEKRISQEEYFNN